MRLKDLPACLLGRRDRDPTRPLGVRAPPRLDHRPARLVWLVGLILALPATALGQTSGAVASPPPLSSAAQSALDKGLAAARQQDWLVAVRYFGQARDRAPDAPAPLYNLGLAEAQLPGRELRALCWFEAYLALAPNAANAAAVRQEMSELNTRAEGHALKVIEILKVLAAQTPASDYWAKIAGLEAKAGDMGDVADILRNRPDEDSRSIAGGHVVAALAARSKFHDAQAYAELISNSVYKEYAYDAIFKAQLAAAMLAEAKTSMTHTSSDLKRSELASLAAAEYRAGDVADATATIAELRDNISKDTADNSNINFKELDLSKLAAAEYNSGQRQEAEILFREIKIYSDSLAGKDENTHRISVLTSLASAENTIGRRSEALALMREANAARLAAEKAHEESQSIFGSDGLLWLTTLDNLQDYGGAQALLPQLRGPGSATGVAFRQDQLAEARETAAAGVADTACAAAETASKKVLATGGASPPQRAQAWSDYIKGCLSRPLYMTDMNVTIAGLAHYAPRKNLGNGAEMIFDHTLKPADDLLDRLNEIGDLEHP